MSVEEWLARDREVIAAMQRRLERNPVRWLLWRKPWRAPHGMALRGYPLRSWPFNAWQWLAYAHDCSDPSVGCSCSGGYRFPRLQEEK